MGSHSTASASSTSSASVMDLLRDHGALNASVAARIAADAKLTAARAAMMRGIGFGAVVLALGLATCAGLIGWSYTQDAGPAAQRIAAIVARAVEGTELRATGSVAIAPGQGVTLAPGGQVALQPGGTVAMDPTATVKAVGAPVTAATTQPGVPEGSPALNPAFMVQSGAYAASPGGPVSTAVMVEKSVATGQGVYVTQWAYDSPSDPAPRRQFCYRGTSDAGRTAERNSLILVAIDGRPFGTQADPPDLRNCVWFEASLTR